MRLQWRAISLGDVTANSWRKQETALIIDLFPIIRLSVQYLFTQLQKARIVYTGVDLQGPINSAFTEPVITAGTRTLGCPLRRVPSAGSFHQQITTLLSSLHELSEERSYSESPYTVITICHFRSVVFPPASLIGPSGKAVVGSA
jgi:hypothetical protein